MTDGTVLPTTGHLLGSTPYAVESDLYPPTEPYAHGMPDVGDGNRVHWETSGNPDGKPAVMPHGGLGQGSLPRLRDRRDELAAGGWDIWKAGRDPGGYCAA